MRDLIRTRKQALDALKIAKQQLLSFLLRHGLRYQHGSYWTMRHRRWLAEMRRFRYAHQQLAFEELKRAIDQIETRIADVYKRQLGYDDHGSFYRAFQKWEGMPPAEWRTAQTKKLAAAAAPSVRSDGMK